MKPLVERISEACRRCGARRQCATSAWHPPDSVVDRQVKSGIEPRAQVSIVFSGPFQNDESHRVVANAMADTLGGNLQRTLREDLGGTYGVSVEPN
jgi:zinc protease